jgi:hypothetical protein
VRRTGVEVDRADDPDFGSAARVSIRRPARREFCTPARLGRHHLEVLNH